RDAEREARVDLSKALTASKASEDAARTQEKAATESAKQARVDRVRAYRYSFEAQTVVERMARRLDAPDLPRTAAMADVRRAMPGDLLGYFADLAPRRR